MGATISTSHRREWQRGAASSCMCTTIQWERNDSRVSQVGYL